MSAPHLCQCRGEDVRSLPLRGRTGVDEIGAGDAQLGTLGVGGRLAGGLEDVGVDAVGNHHHVAGAQGAGALGDLLVDGDDAPGTTHRVGLGGTHRPHHRIRGTGGGGGVGPDVRGVPDIGQTAQCADGARHHAGGGRRLDEDDIGSGGQAQTQGEGHVEGEVGQIAAQVAAGVPQGRPARDAYAPGVVDLRRRFSVPPGHGRGQGPHRHTVAGQGAFDTVEPEGGGSGLGQVDTGGQQRPTSWEPGHGFLSVPPRTWATVRARALQV